MTTHKSLRIDDELAEKVARLARESGVSWNAQAESLIRAGIDAASGGGSAPSDAVVKSLTAHISAQDETIRSLLDQLAQERDLTMRALDTAQTAQIAHVGHIAEIAQASTEIVPRPRENLFMRLFGHWGERRG